MHVCGRRKAPFSRGDTPAYRGQREAKRRRAGSASDVSERRHTKGGPRKQRKTCARPRAATHEPPATDWRWFRPYISNHTHRLVWVPSANTRHAASENVFKVGNPGGARRTSPDNPSLLSQKGQGRKAKATRIEPKRAAPQERAAHLRQGGRSRAGARRGGRCQGKVRTRWKGDLQAILEMSWPSNGPQEPAPMRKPLAYRASSPGLPGCHAATCRREQTAGSSGPNAAQINPPTYVRVV